ncbi:MAG: hypothetical protein HQL08_09550 [Nitrospirae bacterium]|nr:hypothetical protein [Nitrospirota bacterium]
MKKSFFSYAVTSLIVLLSVPCHAASSVYIPGVPSASSSAMGISCAYNYPAAGVVYCTNQSSGPQVSSGGVISAGYQNRVMFITPNTYAWTVPSRVTKMKAVVIGAGGNGSTVNGGSGGGYAEKVYTVSGGQAISVTVQAGGSGNGASTSVSIGGVTISARGGANASTTVGSGSGGDINTSGGKGNGGGGGAGGPYANGGWGCNGGRRIR